MNYCNHVVELGVRACQAQQADKSTACVVPFFICTLLNVARTNRGLQGRIVCRAKGAAEAEKPVVLQHTKASRQLDGRNLVSKLGENKIT